MKIEEGSVASYPLSSQQCAAHVADWQERAPVHAILIDGHANGMQVDALRVALQGLIERHEILRTCYRPVVGLCYPLQHVRTSLTAGWKVCDATVDDESLLREARSAVELRAGPVVGSALAKTADGRLRWALAAPAYSLDPAALQQLASECLRATGREQNHQPDEVIQYPDYVAWQGELRASELGRDGVRFWEHQATLSSQPSRLPFETDSAMDAGHAESLALSRDAEAAVAALSAHVNVPAEMAMLALWAGFMARVMQSDSLPFDWHSDMRIEELQGALGNFSMKLPVVLDLAGDVSIEVMLSSSAAQLRAALSWRECFDAAAYADHLAKVETARHGIEFAYVRMLPLPDGWAFRRIEPDSCDARLLCVCLNDGGNHVLRWQGTASHVPGTLRTWMHQFGVLLESAGRHPEQPWKRLPMLGRTEREQIQRGARPDWPERMLGDPYAGTLHGLFEAQVERVPERHAVVCGKNQLTYRELDRRANALTLRLRGQGVAAERRIGLYLGRSADAIVAMLAVLKSGAAYVPLDPSYPRQRIDDMVADADVSIIVGTEHDRQRFTGPGLRYLSIDEPTCETQLDSAEREAAPNHLAYVIYTSGSTGKPKGVMVSQANAVASTLARFEFYRTPVERFLLLSSPSFDSSVAGIYWTLSQGGTLHIPTEGLHHDPAHIATLIVQERISHLLALPSLYKQVLESLDDSVDLKCAVVAGEACHADLVQWHRRKAPVAVLVNEYGPTEGTVWSNAFRIDGATMDGVRIPIGRPIASMYGYVLDECLDLCPIGSPGEWYIGGEGVARGYMRRPGMTAQRFVADPLGSGERLYRTGDRVRLRPDGEVEYLGRADNQVKLRGYRIELDEIEAALRSHQGVREAAALVHEDDQLGQRLAGFFAMAGDVSDAGQQVFREELLAHLRRVLPGFMVPAHLVPVASLPLMPNGKCDRRALIALLDHGLKAPYVAAADEMERALAQIWESALNVECVGMRDNFFELGGHSLLATQVVSRIRQALAVELPLKDLFDTATLSDLASRVRLLIDASSDELAAMETVMADAEE